MLPKPPKAATLTTFVLLLPSATLAHDTPSGWIYEPLCCGSRDCAPIASRDIMATRDGWYIKRTGELMRYGDWRIKRSGDGFFHRCAPHGDMSSRYTYCIFVPDLDG